MKKATRTKAKSFTWSSYLEAVSDAVMSFAKEVESAKRWTMEQRATLSPDEGVAEHVVLFEQVKRAACKSRDRTGDSCDK